MKIETEYHPEVTVQWISYKDKSVYKTIHNVCKVGVIDNFILMYYYENGLVIPTNKRTLIRPLTSLDSIKLHGYGHPLAHYKKSDTSS